ncbi:MAG TPA: SMC-Scp complex subunit ScpB [Thermomicrobiales bacterium]|nr:SMC-Scp complex subunit ScpB [Thermomicrobiales bacterium]
MQTRRQMTDPAPVQPQLELMEFDEDDAPAVLEAMLFASGETEDIVTLAAALGWSRRNVRAAIDMLERQLMETKRGVALQRSGESVQLVTEPRYARPVARLLGIERRARLSTAALETLALVAYRQPVTRAEIEAVRGVDSSGVLSTLIARELIETLGRRPTAGSPVEYGTTSMFLQFFGLMSLSELPDPPESGVQA